jgi:hypothetical protein
MANIKVNRIKLISELEAAKARLLDNAKQLNKDWEAYDKEVEAWIAKAIKQAKLSWATPENYGNRISLNVPESMPKPKSPSSTRPSQSTWRHDFNRRGEHITLNEVTERKVAQIDNTLKLLALSTEDSVGAATYKEVSQYL